MTRPSAAARPDGEAPISCCYPVGTGGSGAAVLLRSDVVIEQIAEQVRQGAPIRLRQLLNALPGLGRNSKRYRMRFLHRKTPFDA